jgi:hypothetical protein
MRPLLSLLLFSLFLTTAKAQSISKESYAFLQDAYKNLKHSANPFIYSKGIGSYEMREIIEALQKEDTLKKWDLVNNKPKTIDSLVISKQEKEFIIREIKKQANEAFWDSIDIPNSLAIPSDTITAIFKDRERSWKYFREKYGSSFNTFTMPVFFRKKQLCAFYYEHECGDRCSSGVLAIYRKEKGHWVLWFVIYEWIS